MTGTPQGGVISPLLANAYLHRLDRAWRGAYGRLVRYADDALVMCRSKGQAVSALARLTILLADLGLEPKVAKTRIVHLTVGEGVDFLGFHHRLAAPVEQVVQDINMFLRGWAGYFRFGNSARAFDKIRNYALLRLALFLGKRHQRGRSWGFARVYRSPDSLGLISLNGIVAAPRPNRAWRAPTEHRRHERWT